MVCRIDGQPALVNRQRDHKRFPQGLDGKGGGNAERVVVWLIDNLNTGFEYFREVNMMRTESRL